MTNNIQEAVIAVMNDVGYVKKTKSGGLTYSFAGEAALIAALRPSMVENNIFMFVSEIHDMKRENYTTAKGTAMVNTVILANVTFTHAPSNTSITVQAVGEGSDAGDKSANKAMTGLYKYAIRQTFCIETGDDPDKFPSEQRKAQSGISDELWKHFTKVAKEAEALGVEVVVRNREDYTKETITAKGLELAESIKQIKAQKKAGE